MNTLYRAAGATHIGRRESNQDAFVVRPELGLFAVADGMGGYAGGEIASSLAAESVSRFVGRTLRGDNIVWPGAPNMSISPTENLVSFATRMADSAIIEKRVGELDKMGSTLSVFLGERGRAVLGHVGDSRIYRLRAGQLRCLTADHTLYAQLVAEGHDMPPPEEYPYSNVITRALGSKGEADVATIDVVIGDRFVLCTDGLTGPLPDPVILAICDGEAPGRAAQRLCSEAAEAGGSDNITAVVVDYVG